MAIEKNTFLSAAEFVLRELQRPLSSRALFVEAERRGLIQSKGLAPHKTMNARLSEDIKNNSQSMFMRTFHGQFGLREWASEIPEFATAPRKLNPMDENILVIPRSDFTSIISSVIPQGDFYPIPLSELLSRAVSKKRAVIEEDNGFVQIISLFHIVKGSDVLTYKRTSRLPEARLHHRRSINFGGHLQDLDRAPLFEHSQPDELELFFTRELFEELRFLDNFSSPRYVGSIHSDVDAFSLRHVGVCFQVTTESDRIESNEPGFHVSVEFKTINEVAGNAKDYDEWTFLVMRHVGLSDAQ